MKHNALIYQNTFKNVNTINLKTAFYHSYMRLVSGYFLFVIF